jgi:hypothetical protein
MSMLRYKAKRTPNGLDVRFYRLFDALRPAKKWVQFRQDGIWIVTRMFGIPLDRKWFDRSKIYGFGYATHGHSHSQMLQFVCMGEGQVVLAKNAQKGEVASFVALLQQDGLDYPQSWELPSSPQFPSFVSEL